MNTPFSLKTSKETTPKKINRYIEVVASRNPRLNAMAPDSQLTILTTLRRQYARVEITIVENLSDLKKLVAKKPDLVVLGMKLILLDPSMSYDDSPKIWLSSYLEENGINFTGSSTDALGLEFDKHLAKQTVIDAGLRSPTYFIARMNQPIRKHGLKFPLFVKPTNRGDSKGIDENSVVHSELELTAKIVSIHTDCSSDALVEEYLPGREFSVAVLETHRVGNNLLAMPVEITAPSDDKGNRFLSEAVKVADSEQVSAVVEPALKKKINSLAIGVFKALGSRDYGRIDVRLDAFGTPSFIEANLMPGLSDHGYLSSCFYINNQIAYEDMILSIVAISMARFRDVASEKSVNARHPALKRATRRDLTSSGLRA